MSDAQRTVTRAPFEARPVLLLLAAELTRQWIEPALPAGLSAVLPWVRTGAALVVSGWPPLRIALRTATLCGLLAMVTPAEAGAAPGPHACALGDPSPRGEVF